MPPYHIALTLMIFFSSRNFPTTVNLDTDGSYSRSYSIENKQKSINHCVIICTACILSRSGRFQAEIRTCDGWSRCTDHQTSFYFSYNVSYLVILFSGLLHFYFYTLVQWLCSFSSTLLARYLVIMFSCLLHLQPVSGYSFFSLYFSSLLKIVILPCY